MSLEALVIGGDHYNTLNVVRALGSDGIRVLAVITTKSPKSFVLKSKYINKGYIVNTLKVEWLIETLGRKDCRVPVLATNDEIASILDLNYNKLSEYFILPSVRNKQGALTMEMDKNVQLSHAADVGFDIPKSHVVRPADFSISELKYITYPCLIKPEESICGSKNDFRICGNQDELMSNLNDLSDHLSRVLVQDYIPNDHVILVAGVRTLSGDNYTFGEVNKMKHGKELRNLGLNCFGVLNPSSLIAKMCEEYVEHIDYHGCYSVDVVRLLNPSVYNSRTYNFFMEINLRTDGLLYFYNKGGVNFPAIWIKSCYGEIVDVTPSKKLIYGMNEFLYIKNGLSFSLLGDFFKTNVFTTFSLDDLNPFIYRFIYHE